MAACLAASPLRAQQAPARWPFAPGERLTMRFSYLHLTAGRGSLRVLASEKDGRAAIQFVSEAKS